MNTNITTKMKSKRKATALATAKEKANKKMKPKHALVYETKQKLTHAKHILQIFAVLLCCMSAATTAFAAGTDPLAAINNLSDFVFQAIKAIGMLILLFGLVQLGLSIQSHDTQQRSQGILCMLGGLIIAFAKEILDMIL